MEPFRRGEGMAGIKLSSTSMDLVDAIREILKASHEPLTLRKIRQRLRAPFDGLTTDELSEVLRRQVAANVLVMCPKYRSSQDRYWNRTLRDHATVLLHMFLEPGPLSWADL